MMPMMVRGTAIEDNYLSHNVWVRGELALPQPFGNHDRGICAQAVFVGSKRSAGNWRNTKQFKEAGRDHLGFHVLGFAGAR